MSKIIWPDFTFPPLNLWNVWPHYKDWYRMDIYDEVDRDYNQIDWVDLDKDVRSWESSTKKVIRDMKDREAFGLQKYGKALTVATDEDMLQHLYEELLDASVYIKTLIEQRKL